MMGTHDTAFVRVPGRAVGLAVALVLLLAGCGEGVGTLAGSEAEPTSGTSQNDSGPSNDTDDPNGSDGSDGSNGSEETDDNTDEGNKEPVEYVWGLPSSDTSVGDGHQGAEGSAYEALQRSCSEGAEFLQHDFAPEYGFESPRNVLLFAAGVQLCEGDSDEARAFFNQAEVYGTAGLTPDGWAFCDLYRVVRSVLEQRPREDFQCGGGTAPGFKAGDSAIDDPLTPDVDESLAETETDPGGDTGTETDPDGKTETETETETDGEAETDTDSDSDPAPETGTEPAR